MRDMYYPGTNTRVTDGLYLLECENGHTFWHLTPADVCSACGGKIVKGNVHGRNEDGKIIKKYLPIIKE